MSHEGIDLAYVAEQQADLDSYLAACDVKRRANIIAYIVNMMVLHDVTTAEVKAAMRSTLE